MISTGCRYLGKKQSQQGEYHTVALPLPLQCILRQKEELWKLKYFTMQKYNLQKNPLKETKIPQRRIMETQIFHHAKI
jgi:hypothetical protein